MSAEKRTDLVLEILAGELTVEDAAAANRVAVEEVTAWRDLYLAAGRRHRLQADELEQAAPPGPRNVLARPGVRAALGLSALALVLLVGNKVVADYYPGCVTQTDFTCFNPTTPAKASEVNDNFSMVVDWIEQKLGPVGSADITFGGQIGSGGLAIALSPGGRITGVGRVVGNDGFVLRGASGNGDDLTVGADGMVTIPDLTVTNSLAIPGGLPITIESAVSQAFTIAPQTIDLGEADGKRVCFLARQTFMTQDPVGVNMPHNIDCRVRISSGQWQLYGYLGYPSDTLTCTARCITW